MHKPLPAGWERLAIGTLVTESQYGLSEPANETGKLPIVGMKDMIGGKVRIDALARVLLDPQQVSSYLLRRGDILLNRTNSPDLVGKVAIWDHDLEATFASYLVRFRFKEHQARPKYINHLLNAAASQTRLRQLSTRAISQANINPTVFQRYFEVALAPIAEQDGIIDILDECDRALAAVDALAEARRQHKKSLGQIFLARCLDRVAPTGWAYTRLRDAFVERDERGESLRLLAITGTGGIVGRETIERRDTSAADKSAYKVIRPGDLGYNTMRMWQGVSGLSQLTGLVSPAYTVVTPIEGVIHGAFAAHLFKLAAMIHRFWRYSQGLVDDQLQLRFEHFGEIIVNLPPVAEQAEIALLFDAAEHEIDLLASLADALRHQKRGLMQKLLTGDWRVGEAVAREAAE